MIELLKKLIGCNPKLQLPTDFIKVWDGGQGVTINDNRCEEKTYLSIGLQEAPNAANNNEFEEHNCIVGCFSGDLDVFPMTIEGLTRAAAALADNYAEELKWQAEKKAKATTGQVG